MLRGVNASVVVNFILLTISTGYPFIVILSPTSYALTRKVNNSDSQIFFIEFPNIYFVLDNFHENYLQMQIPEKQWSVEEKDFEVELQKPIEL